MDSEQFIERPTTYQVALLRGGCRDVHYCYTCPLPCPRLSDQSSRMAYSRRTEVSSGKDD